MWKRSMELRVMCGTYVTKVAYALQPNRPQPKGCVASSFGRQYASPSVDLQLATWHVLLAKNLRYTWPHSRDITYFESPTNAAVRRRRTRALRDSEAQTACVTPTTKRLSGCHGVLVSYYYHPGSMGCTRG